MSPRLAVACVVVLAACGASYERADDDPTDASGDAGAGDAAASDATTGDGAADAGTGRVCDPFAPFDGVALVPELSDQNANTAGVRLSPDELTAFFARLASATSWELYYATRFDRGAPFGSPTPLSALNTVESEIKPSITADRSLLYYARFGSTNYRLLVATRTAANDYVSPLDLAPPVGDGGSTGEADPFISDDGAELAFVSARSGKQQIYVATDRSGPTTFGRVDLVASADAASNPVLGHDGLTLYFATPEGTAGSAVVVARRASPGAAFGAPAKLTGPALDVPDQRDEPTWISVDACTLYLQSNRAGVFATYRATRTPK